MNTKGQKIFIFAVMLFSLAAYFIIRASLEDDEARIRRVIHACALAVEKQDLIKCSQFISSEYDDKYGQNKSMFLRSILKIFREQEDIKIDIKKLKIEVEGLKAEAEIGFKSYFRNRGEEQMYYDTASLKVRFQKEDGRWKVLEVEYSGSNEVLYLRSVA